MWATDGESAVAASVVLVGALGVQSGRSHTYTRSRVPQEKQRPTEPPALAVHVTVPPAAPYQPLLPCHQLGRPRYGFPANSSAATPPPARSRGTLPPAAAASPYQPRRRLPSRDGRATRRIAAATPRLAERRPSRWRETFPSQGAAQAKLKSRSLARKFSRTRFQFVSWLARATVLARIVCSSTYRTMRGP